MKIGQISDVVVVRGSNTEQVDDDSVEFKPGTSSS